MSTSKDRCFDCGEKKETTELNLGDKDAFGRPNVIHVCDKCFEARRYEEEEMIYHSNINLKYAKGILR